MKKIMLFLSIKFFSIVVYAQEIKRETYENGITYVGYDLNDLPEGFDRLSAIDYYGGTEFSLKYFRYVGYSMDQEGEIIRVFYQDIGKSWALNSDETTSPFYTEVLIAFWTQYEPGDIVKAPAVRVRYGDYDYQQYYELDIARIFKGKSRHSLIDILKEL